MSADAMTTHASIEAVPLPAKTWSTWRVALLAIVVLCGFGGLGVLGMRGRAQTTARAALAPQATDRPRVMTDKARIAPSQIEQVLPATATPLYETDMYARTSGYVKKSLVEVGDTVKAGQLLAEIATPEVDNQLEQARAALKEAREVLSRNQATEALAQTTNTRARRLAGTNSIAIQEVDDSSAALKVAGANVRLAKATIASSEANVKRLEDLQGFQRIVAPFDGVITARNYDPGALVVADSVATRMMFHVSQIDKLRVMVDVPQAMATSIRVGQTVPVFLRETPDKVHNGVVTRTTRSVNVQTRTLRVEVQVQNTSAELLPGMYLQARFRIDSATNVLHVPGAAVIVRATGTRVAVLGPSNAVEYRDVRLGRDFGSTVEVLSGLKAGETVVIRPGDDMPEGTVVEVATGQ